MKEFPRKFLSLRDKQGAQSRSKSAPPSNKHRQRSAEAFFALFKNDKNKTTTGEDETEDHSAKIEDVQRRLDELGITNVTPEHIKDILATQFGNGDITQTAEFIDLEQQSALGKVMPYNPRVHMLGAENRGGVTCYLDALLFAMFCRLDAYESMLQSSFAPDDPKNRLVNLLRVWVNMLRSGKLINTDLTKLIQDSLGDCGWPDARLLEQQDTSEAFAFLTETLELPLLSLQVDLFHQGKKDDDDHKVVYERLLNLAVPPMTEGKGIKLEDCLEEYFNARVDVLRDSEEAKKSFIEEGSPDTPTLVHRNTIRLLRDEEGGTSTAFTASPVDMAPLHPFPSRSSIGTSASAAEHAGGENDATGHDSTSSPTTARRRATSVIQRVVLDEEGKPTNEDKSTTAPKSRRKGSIVVKAVTIPAWQFFRLIPWHAIKPSEPRNDSEVALNFEQRPVVGICLKRYAMTESGQPSRHNTYIDIPDSLRLPHFMMANEHNMENGDSALSTEYKLVLQSVVCHRGDSLQSGHYIAFARVAPKLLRDNRRHDFDPPPDYEEAQWVLFDDLEENRVTYVDDFRKALTEEMPYLLFYQVVPMVEITCPSTDGTATGPPSYQESKTSLELQTSRGLTDGRQSVHSKPPSIRLSLEAERPSRKYFDVSARPSISGSTPGSRRESLNFIDSAAVTPAITPARTPEGASPVISPSDTNTSRLSRAASRFTIGRQSRPPSQSSDGRISMTMSRLGGFMKTSKEPLVEGNDDEDTPVMSPTKTSFDILRNMAEQEQESDKTPQAAAQKHGHGYHKSKVKEKAKEKAKEKPSKQKQNSQPERECVVM